MSYQDKQTNNRVSLAPECSPASDIVSIPANAVPGTAENIMTAIAAAYAAATAKELDAGAISGIIISPTGACLLRTAKIGAAGTGGVQVANGERFYFPNPQAMSNPLLYEATDPVICWVLH